TSSSAFSAGRSVASAPAPVRCGRIPAASPPPEPSVRIPLCSPPNHSDSRPCGYTSLLSCRLCKTRTLRVSPSASPSFGLLDCFTWNIFIFRIRFLAHLLDFVVAPFELDARILRIAQGFRQDFRVRQLGPVFMVDRGGEVDVRQVEC